jgi:PKHD-type hydroxylase
MDHAGQSPGDAMQIVIGNVLTAEDVKTVRAALKRACFIDGRASAGFAARTVKSNQQAAGSDRSLETIRKLVADRILGNEVFRLAVRPKMLSPLLFSRYEKGMHYGSHVDDALMGGMRTDVSFTLFLSDPKSYEGGALAIESPSGEESFKLAAGSLVAYPSSSLHQVTAVTPRSGATRAVVRSRYRAAAGVRPRRQVGGIRPRFQVAGESDADVGRGLSHCSTAGTEERITPR